MSTVTEYAASDNVPDPTRDVDPGDICRDTADHYVCTARRGHDGPHLAGSFSSLAASWPRVGRA